MTLADSLVAERTPLRQEADGTIRVGKTRMTLDIVIESYLQGMTPEEIVTAFETLDIGDVYAAIAHYHHHRIEVEEYLRVRADRAEVVRQLWEQRAPSDGLRDRLVAKLADANKSE